MKRHRSQPPFGCRPCRPPPAGNDAVVTVKAGAAPTAKVISWLAVIFTAVGDPVTWKVTEPLPPPVGVPVMAPVLGFKVNPGGSVPAMTVHAYGLAPPDSVNVWFRRPPQLPLEEKRR